MSVFLKKVKKVEKNELQQEVAQLDVAFLALYNMLIKNNLIDEKEFKAEIKRLSEEFKAREG